jgi:hypothetical protein
MKLRELKAALNELTEEQLEMDAKILDSDNGELYPISDTVLFSELPQEMQDKFLDIIEEDNPLLIS